MQDLTIPHNAQNPQIIELSKLNKKILQEIKMENNNYGVRYV